MNNWHILTECYVDTLLVEVISPPRKGYNHQHSCTKVLSTMKVKFQETVALGIIDDDKLEPKELENFSLLKQANEQLSIYKHKDKPHYVVKISKAVEDFILKNAKKCEIDLAAFDLPSDLEGLKKITKHINSLKDAEIKIKKAFTVLKLNEKSDFNLLAQWIELFKNNPYHCID